MKKLIWVILSLIVVLGIGATVMNIGNFRVNMSNFSVEKLIDQKTNLETENIKNLDVNIQNAKVEVRTGSRSQVEFKNVTKGQFKVSQQTGTVKIKQTNLGTRLGKASEIIITVPQKIDNLTISHVSGTLKLTGLTIEHLDINHKNGTTVISDSHLDSGIINKKNGSTTLKQVEVPGLKVSVKTGNFKLNGVTKAHGNQTYDDEQAKQLIIKSNTGQVEVTKL